MVGAVAFYFRVPVYYTIVIANESSSVLRDVSVKNGNHTLVHVPMLEPQAVETRRIWERIVGYLYAVVGESQQTVWMCDYTGPNLGVEALIKRGGMQLTFREDTAGGRPRPLIKRWGKTPHLQAPSCVSWDSDTGL
jgi:hypothetical protein